MSSSRPIKIDVHAHIVPPKFREALLAFGGDPAGWHIPEWTPEAAIEVQDELKITTSVLSVTSPGCLFLDREGNRELARECNLYASSVREAHPDRFAFYATLSNPAEDMDGCLAEMRYALDTLNADGVCLFTQYDGLYLGHPTFEPLWAELDRLATTVIIHPTPPQGYKPMPEQKYCPCPAFDFPHETTKTVSDLIMSERRSQYSKVNIVLCHGGGTIPFLADRIAFTTSAPALKNPTSPDQVIKGFKSFHYDTALVGTSPAFDCTKAFVPEDKLVIGSDHPYAVREGMVAFSRAVDERLGGDEKQMVWENNAKALFPRLAVWSQSTL